MTIKEIARLIKKSHHAIRKMIKSLGLEPDAYKGKTWVFNSGSIEKIIAGFGFDPKDFESKPDETLGKSHLGPVSGSLPVKGFNEDDLKGFIADAEQAAVDGLGANPSGLSPELLAWANSKPAKDDWKEYAFVLKTYSLKDGKRVSLRRQAIGVKGRNEEHARRQVINAVAKSGRVIFQLRLEASRPAS